MIPVITLIGRPNTGKSTLFNKLTFSSGNIISNIYGTTKDRNYILSSTNKYKYLLVDTIGLNFSSFKTIIKNLRNNLNYFVDESDIILYILDGCCGLFYEDIILANFLRKIHKYVFLIINKIDNLKIDFNNLNFYTLGLGKPYIISSCHFYNISNMINNVLDIFCKNKLCKNFINFKKIKISLLGKPNVGKSTLINSFLNENRINIHKNSNTTKDSIFVNFKYKNYIYNFIDTYGLKQKNKFNILNKFFIIKTLQSIIISNIILFLFDVTKNISKQDYNIFNFIIKYNCCLIILINKIDLITLKEKIYFKNFLKKKFKFFNYCYLYYISAINNYNLNYIINCIYKIYTFSNKNFNTNKLNNIVLNINNFIIFFKKNNIFKVNYAHQGSKNPPSIIIHGYNLKKINNYYNNIFEKLFRKEFNLKSIPLLIKYCL